MTMQRSGFAKGFMIILMGILSSLIAQAANPPLFELKNLDGDSYSLQDDLGKSVIILDFWATWCKPCLRELPHINAIYEKYREKGLKVYAISVDDASSTSSIKPTLKRYSFSMPILLDPNSDVIRKYNANRNIPYLVLIGADGQIIRDFTGYKPGDEKLVEELVTAEIAKMSKPETSAGQNPNASEETGGQTK